MLLPSRTSAQKSIQLAKNCQKRNVRHNYLLGTLKKRIQRLENDVDDEKKDDELSLSQNTIADIKCRKIEYIRKARGSAKAQNKSIPAGREYHSFRVAFQFTRNRDDMITHAAPVNVSRTPVRISSKQAAVYVDSEGISICKLRTDRICDEMDTVRSDNSACQSRLFLVYLDTSLRYGNVKMDMIVICGFMSLFGRDI